MFEKLKPYPKYRNAEGEWLGKVPEHWNVKRVKYLLSEVDRRSTTGKEQLLRVSQYSGVTQRVSKDGADGPDTRAESLVGYKQVAPNNLVVNIMLAWNGSMGVSRFSGIASPAYCVYNFNNNTLPWYYHHLLRSPIYKARIKALSTGVVESRLRLYTDSFFRMEAILPPPEEQEAIVRFLDHANAKLEKAIRSKKKIIALLNEQKQAIIHQAVTKGLNPKVKMKDSGIPWLGEIPAHWEVKQIKRITRTCSGATPPSGEVSKYYSGSIPWIRTMDLNNSVLTKCEEFITEFALETTACKIVPKGSVLVAMYGGAGTIGKCGLLNFESTTNQALCVIFPSPTIIPEYLLFFMLYYRPYWMIGADGTRKDPNISQDRIRNTHIIIPSLHEQEAIVKDLKFKTSEIDIVIDLQLKEINHLTEYRTRLIADVVTGKLDVREAAKNLPSEVQEVEDAVDEDETIDEEGESDE